MAGQTKRVDLKETWIYAGKHYGPGKNIEVPADFRGGEPSRGQKPPKATPPPAASGPQLVTEGTGDTESSEGSESSEGTTSEGQDGQGADGAGTQDADEGGTGESDPDVERSEEESGEAGPELQFEDVPGRAEFEGAKITTLDAVRALHAEGKLQSVSGVGPKREKQVIDFLEGKAEGSQGPED